MAQFTTSFLSIDQNLDVMNYFAEQNQFANLHFQSPIMGMPMDNLFMQQHQPHDQFQEKLLAENFPGIFNHHEDDKSLLFPVSAAANSGSGFGTQEGIKRKEPMEDLPESSSGYSEDGGIKRKNSSGGGKRRKRNEKVGEEKGKEVVHVRARRGQATDSHSLAERVRRGKINERLKCLQGIVPGCYKAMGMAVMLDEIINYVQSLQNQVEFLSMKLNAASVLQEFNLETHTTETIQRLKAFEAEKVQRLVATERYEGHIAPTTQLGSFDLTFGSQHYSI